MKKIYISILLATVIISVSSCRKYNDTKPEVPVATLEDSKFDPSFGWNTSRNVDFTISSTKDVLICITSSDDSIRYHRGMLIAKNNGYKVKLSLPMGVKQLNINGKPVDVAACIINYDLK